MAISIVSVILILLIAAGVIFIHQPSFGRLPRGERKERIIQSPQYRNGEFRNYHDTPLMTSGKSRFRSLSEFLLDKPEGVYPGNMVSAVKTDLKHLPAVQDVMVWFGHSSYLLQLSGKRFLVDPVFCMASPVSFFNKPFHGTDIYDPEDMPVIDYLVITHDHWDHLDYHTVKRLKDRIGKVICPLGVGEHFEYWGFDNRKIIELDWRESASLVPGFTVYCLPARHFSGRGLISNQTLWASFLIESPSINVYIGGDSGYDTHYKEIGEQYGNIDLAILENGQYSENWKYIHMMPYYLGRAAKELNAGQIITVHHSKYALSKHRWDEPLENEKRAAAQDSLSLIISCIGEIIPLQSGKSLFKVDNRKSSR
ncbi:MBL fold metallo-hydrolase [Coprobacter sp. LH1063]|uniref:MBL fold metallo-hydrolase n=2 Tax=Coprobacter tertius TaxID=2944915 RepID=A0ABT1MK15_9BACT|nr:MBL fold metallo-hydrolase [Coprobacter tertius]MCP9612781.1 MBL fold metallo-hydrolase [Coprobacter tertius]